MAGADTFLQENCETLCKSAYLWKNIVEIMRKKILTIIFIAVAAVSAASAQPRALGIRVGVSGLEADYQDLTSDTMPTEHLESRQLPCTTSYGPVQPGQTRVSGLCMPVRERLWDM